MLLEARPNHLLMPKVKKNWKNSFSSFGTFSVKFGDLENFIFEQF